MQCKLCLQEKPLIPKSHIIPRQFFHKMSENKDFGDVSRGERVPRAYSKNTKSKQVQSGIYVPDILCKECEQRLGVLDNYAQTELLKNKPTKNEEFIYLSPLLSVWQIKNFDYKKLKLFFLSILFRSHICNDEAFENVNLTSALEDELREMIIKEYPGDENKFPVFLWGYKGKFSGYVSVHECEKPFNGYLFRLLDYSCTIQLDDNEIADDIKKTLLTPTDSFKVYVLDHENSQDYNIVSNLVQKFQE